MQLFLTLPGQKVLKNSRVQLSFLGGGGAGGEEVGETQVFVLVKPSSCVRPWYLEITFQFFGSNLRVVHLA